MYKFWDMDISPVVIIILYNELVANSGGGGTSKDLSHDFMDWVPSQLSRTHIIQPLKG